jgi:protein disulfide-isomerase A1
MSKIFKVLAVLAIFAVVTVSAAEYVEEEDVLVLGDSSLAEALKEFEYVLVEFYAPWCGHCKKLAPEYAKAAAALKSEGSVARLAKVDSTVEKQSAEKYGVKGYPTLKFFIKGEPVEYEGGRTEKDIVNWIKRKTLPSTLEVSTSEQLASSINGNEVLVVFFGGKEVEGYSAFESASKKFDDVGFVYTSNTDLKTEHSVAEGTNVLLLKKFDEGRNELAGSFDVAKLTEFVESSRFPLVLPFDQKAAQKIFGEAIPSLFLIFQKNEAGERAEAVFRETAAKLKGKIQFSISDIKDGGLGPRLAEFVGVKESDTPAFRIVVPQKSGAPKKFLFENEATVENLVKFFEDYSAGKLSAFLKSEPIPESNDSPVKVVVGKNFDEIVLDPTKDVFIEFYAPWCGHCKKLSPIWDELASQLSSIKDLVIAKMDSTANEVESVSVSGFPTLKFYPRNSKQNPINYDGERTKDGFLAWLKDKVTVEHASSAFSKSDEL